MCIDCRYLGPRPSGIAECVGALVDHAPALAPDIEFLFLCHPAFEGRLSVADNVREHVVQLGANHPGAMWLMPELAPLAGCDLFHAPSNILPARLAMKTVTTVHDIMWLTHPQWCETGWKAPFKRRFFGSGISRALARSDAIATVSAATRDAIARFAPESANRLVVTRSGVAERFAPVGSDAHMLAAIGLPPGAPFALVVGQDAPYKNHAMALRAFADALGGEETALCVFVQRRGHGASDLAGIARELGLAERVIFTGPVGEETLIQLYSSARLLLHPSLCEGFGNPVAEAMACGCPVITSDRSAMPEVAGGAARLVDPRDEGAIAQAIQTVWASETERARMREAGIARARELSWKDFARTNVAIYRDLLGIA